MKHLIITNLINLVILGVVVLGFFTLPKWLTVLLILIWFGVVVFTNYNLLIKGSEDLISKLKSSDKDYEFDDIITILVDSYYSVEGRKDLFSTLENNLRIQETYNLISNQVSNNIKAVTVFIENYDYRSRPSKEYCIALVAETRDLVNKLNQLVELVISINNSVEDVDISSVDDILSSLRSVLKNEE